MSRQPPLLTCRPSHYLKLYLLTLYALLCVACLYCQAPPWLQVTALLMLFFDALRLWLQQIEFPRDQLSQMQLASDNSLLWLNLQTQEQLWQVLAILLCSEWLVVLRLKKFCGSSQRYLVIWRDQMSPQDYRRYIVQLRTAC